MKKGEFDRELDTKSHLLRWVVVAVAFILTAEFSTRGLSLARVMALTDGLAFLCWPNFAYYLTNLAAKPFNRD